MKIAIIDLGSNSARMTIWDCTENKREVLSNNRIYVRLSEGLSEDNILKEEPMHRALSALSTFSEIIKKERCDRVISVGTEALRRAENRDDFLLRAKNLGFFIKILSGDDEAKYDFYAAQDLIGKNSAFLMDVGGGSLELIRVDEGELYGHVCLPLGAVVMSDRFGNNKKELERFFNETFSSLHLLQNAENHFLVGLGGSIRSLFSYSSGINDGNEISKDSFLKFYDKITNTSSEELKKIPAFNDRYDIINAGLAPFYSIFTLKNAEKIVICNKGVREGILRECLKQLT